MKAHYLGHVVFYVKDLQRSLVFTVTVWDSRKSDGSSTGRRPHWISGRKHHELLLIQVGNLSPSRSSGSPPHREVCR